VEVTCSHSKNPALGWDVTAAAKAGAGEGIARAQVIVNDVSSYDKSFNPPLSTWQEQIPQQGEYPGDNEVLVVITSDKDEDTECLDSWS
jgi:hypothetical protein